MYTDKIYDYWIKSFTKAKHLKIINSIRYFHIKKDHYLSLKHTKKYDS
jgi:hypothetical protein